MFNDGRSTLTSRLFLGYSGLGRFDAEESSVENGELLNFCGGIASDAEVNDPLGHDKITILKLTSRMMISVEIPSPSLSKKWKLGKARRRM